MPQTTLGLHHVTATVDEAQADLDFCAGGLGLRLVKQTVNFDNPHVFHFYYGTERGLPGTIWTTFPYRGHGVRPGVIGAGQVTATAFSVPAGSLDFWRAHLSARGATPRDAEPRFGEDVLEVHDPSGLVFELVAGARDTRPPWPASVIDAGVALRGLHSVTLTVRDPAKTVGFMRDHLGFEVADEVEGRTRVRAPGGTPGREVDVAQAQE